MKLSRKLGKFAVKKNQQLLNFPGHRNKKQSLTSRRKTTGLDSFFDVPSCSFGDICTDTFWKSTVVKNYQLHNILCQ